MQSTRLINNIAGFIGAKSCRNLHVFAPSTSVIQFKLLCLNSTDKTLFTLCSTVSVFVTKDFALLRLFFKNLRYPTVLFEIDKLKIKTNEKIWKN